MAIRIRPQEIDVPQSNPFRNDLLGRKESVKTLTHTISSFEGPCALAIDAAWGNGKTTFLNLWAQHLRNEKFPVVKFNAWETDFSKDPLIALSSELTESLASLRGSTEELLTKKINSVKEVVGEILQHTMSETIRVATSGIVDINLFLEAIEEQASLPYAEKKLAKHRETQELFKKFGKTLGDIAEEISAEKGRPLVVMVDELDRCRPSYAVGLLEVAKHLFSVDHIVFVLAINRAQLAHSIKALYGSDFDAEDYLRRFFDMDFWLPDPERGTFITELLVRLQIRDYFVETKIQRYQHDYETVQELLLGFFGSSYLSLRRIAQTIHRFGLVLPSSKRPPPLFAVMVAVALIVKTINSGAYRQFTQGETSDFDVANKVFDTPGIGILRWKDEGAQFEAALVLAAHEISGAHVTEWQEISSPLLQHYKSSVHASSPDPLTYIEPSQARKQKDSVEHWISKFWERAGGREDFGFQHSVQQIELLFSGLTEKVPEQA